MTLALSMMNSAYFSAAVSFASLRSFSGITSVKSIKPPLTTWGQALRASMKMRTLLASTFSPYEGA
jgi:hypothetical protein